MVVPDSLLLRDCGILGAKQTPQIDVILIEVPDEIGGYGAKGAGEIGLVPTAGAVAAALHSFDGIRRFNLPMQDSPAAAPSVPKSRRKKAVLAGSLRLFMRNAGEVHLVSCHLSTIQTNYSHVLRRQHGLSRRFISETIKQLLMKT